jgi:cell wall-associated NlpC family hydrolase
LLITLFLISCSHSKKLNGISKNAEISSKIKIKEKVPSVKINTENTTADVLISYAESLEGTKYKYGGTNEETGFDCSGFVWYVFNHFNIKVPRTSVQFTNAGKEVKITESKRGDIILFTGSDERSRKVGHIGFITANENNKITFLHAASGGGRGVMKSQMSEYFVERFVKVNRIFNY